MKNIFNIIIFISVMVLIKFKWDERHKRIQTFHHPLLTFSRVLTNKDDIKLEYNIQICSYNIKFLSIYKNKNIDFIGSFLKEFCDMVIIQENTASPYLCGNKKTPNTICKNTLKFKEKMNELGFQVHIAEENTGKSKLIRNHLTVEWPTLLYKPEKIRLSTPSIPHYIDKPVRQHSVFERVPYVTPLLIHEKFRLNIINMHLHPGDKVQSRIHRKEQLHQLTSLMAKYKSEQTILAGDFNISNIDELDIFLERNYFLTNASCIATNAKYRKNEECYDHIILNESITKSRRHMESIQVVDLNFLFKSSLMGFLNFGELEHVLSDHLPVIFSIEFK